MLFPAVSVQLVVTVESLPAETAFWVTFEATLIDCTGIVVAKFLMFAKLRVGEQLVFMGEDFLVPRAELAHDFLVCTPYVSMEVAPT